MIAQAIRAILLASATLDVALAVGDHGDSRRPGQHIGGFFGREQATIGFLSLDRTPLGSIDLVPGAIENLSAHHPDDAATGPINGNGRRNKPRSRSLLDRPKPRLLSARRGKLNSVVSWIRQHVATHCALAGDRPVVVSISS